MGLRVERTRKKEEREWRKGTKEDMTSPVKGILMSRESPSPAARPLFLQSRSALFTDHFLFLNLFSVLASLC